MAALGNQLQEPVALGWRRLCRCAWHRARTWRHDDRRTRMTLVDLTVDIATIIGAVAGGRSNQTHNLCRPGVGIGGDDAWR